MDYSKMRLLIQSSIFILISIAGLSAKPVIELAKAIDGYTIHFKVPQFQIVYVDTLGFVKESGYRGETFARFHVPEYQAMNSIGKPALPVVRFYMAIAALNQVPAFEISDMVLEQISLKKRYFPAQEPWVKSQTITDRRFSIDKHYYLQHLRQH